MYVEDISSRCVAARSFIFVWHCLENVLNSTILDTVQRTNWFLGSELDIESWEIAISCCFQLPSCDSFPLIIFRFGFPFQLLMIRLLFFPPILSIWGLSSSCCGHTTVLGARDGINSR